LHNVHLYRQLRANQARLKAILDNASVGVVLLDSAGRYVQVNDRWAEMLGYNGDELLGRHHFDFVYPDDVPDCQQRLAGLQSGAAESYRLEARFSCGDGDFFWGDVSISAIRGPEGNLEAIVTVVADVTERKHEAERERLISELDAFGHTVAHDLKSPLQGIIGYSSLLVEDISQFSSDDLAHFLQIIEQYGHKMTAIINELLLLSRVRKLEEIDIEPVDMKPVVESALIRLEHLIRDKKAAITAPLEAWPVASGYGPWIEEVWANYISNAIKYGGSPPRVQLGADCLPDGAVRFWVRDNGQGIPPERLGQLFTEFTRLGQTRLEGHGLGLSIVRRIMDKLGGEVGVESTLGQGSTFSFTLPGTDSHG
jgi:PAS domain S-box-containing protein